MTTDKHLTELLELDDALVDADQEDIDALMDLLAKREEVAEAFIEPEFVPDTNDEPRDPDDPTEADLQVEFTAKQVQITSPVDRKVELAGDVRNGTARLKAEKTTKRKLTNEGHGFVEIDSVRYNHDQTT